MSQAQHRGISLLLGRCSTEPAAYTLLVDFMAGLVGVKLDHGQRSIDQAMMELRIALNSLDILHGSERLEFACA